MTRRSLLWLVLILSTVTVAARSANATPIAGNSALAAATTKYDPYDHAYVAQTDGAIREIYFQNGKSANSDVIASHSGVVAISAFSNVINYPGAGLRDRIHVVVGMASGDIYDVYYTPMLGVHEYLLTHADTSTGASIQALAAWSSDSGFENLAILMSDGNLYHTAWTDVSAPTEPPTLVAPTTATAIAGYAESVPGPTMFIINHLVLIDTDLIDIAWHNGDEPDLNSSMTTVSTLESGGPGFSGYAAVAGLANYFRIYDVLPVIPTLAPATAGAMKSVVYGIQVGTGKPGTPSLLTIGSASLRQGVAVAAYLDVKDDARAHMITLDINGAVYDQVTQINTSPLSTWLSYWLGNF